MATKFKFYSQEKSMKNIKSSVFSGFMYIGATKRQFLLASIIPILDRSSNPPEKRIRFISSARHGGHNCHYNSFKISRSFWLAKSLRLILHNQSALAIFGSCEQYTIAMRWYIWLETRHRSTSFPGAADRLAVRIFTSELKKNKNGVRGDPETKWLSFWLKLNGRNARIRKKLLDGCYLLVAYFLSSIYKKNICLYPETVPMKFGRKYENW